MREVNQDFGPVARFCAQRVSSLTTSSRSCPTLAPFFAALRKERNASPPDSTVCALFAQNSRGVPERFFTPRPLPEEPIFAIFRNCKWHPVHVGALRRRATSATISKSVSAEKQAKRFFVSGLVQGVGFRYFAQDAAERLRLAGYVRNLRDGRVEAYAIGTEEHLLRFLAALKKGPRGAMVHGVLEESAALDSHYESEFSITHDL